MRAYFWASVVVSTMAHAPNVADWRRLWTLWDSAWQMIPEGRHCDRPLALRQPYIFYLGHMAAFADARLAKVLQEPLTEPAEFADVFARGIDPDLDDPTQCHSHSPTPAQWPKLADILAYRDRVRSRILQLYQHTCSCERSSSTTRDNSCTSQQHSAAADAADSSNSSQLGAAHSKQQQQQCPDADTAAVAALPVALQHVLWMSYEHEAMHLETFIYMLVQYDAVQPPPAKFVPPVPVTAWCSFLHAAATAAAGASTGPESTNGAVSSEHAAEGGLNSSVHDASCCDSIASTRPASPPPALPAQGLLLPLPPAAAWVKVPACTVNIGFTPPNSATSSGGSGSSGTGSNNSSGTTSSSSACSGNAGASGGGTCNGNSKSSSVQPLLFCWDNESPARQVAVAAGELQHRPVTVLEYLQFLACCLTQGMDAMTATVQHTPPAHAKQHQAETAAGPSSSSSVSNSSSGVVAAAPQHLESMSSCCRPNASSSSTSLQSMLAAQRHSGIAACSGCSQALLRLLQLRVAEGLMPASMVLLPAASFGTQTPASAGAAVDTCCGSGTGSVLVGSTSSRCAGLCQLLPVCDGGGQQHPTTFASSCSSPAGSAAASGSSSPSNAAAPACTDAADSRLQAAVFNTLQLLAHVKSVFGSVPISIAGLWPVYCSAIQAEQYAAYAANAWLGSAGGSTGGSIRLPTEPELLAARQQYGGGQHAQAPSGGGKVSDVPVGADFAAVHPLCVPLQAPFAAAAVSSAPAQGNGHSGSSSSSSGSAGSDAAGAAGPSVAAVCQLWDNGWEWTCTTFDSHEGFEPHHLYPEYSQDFFGGKHVVLIGASWATLGSIAQRPSFRNWHQKGQQHVFAKFRLWREGLMQTE